MDIKAETSRVLEQHARDRIRMRLLKTELVKLIPHRATRGEYVKQAEVRRKVMQIEQKMEEREALLAQLIAQEG